MKRPFTYVLGFLLAVGCWSGCSDDFLRLEPNPNNAFVKHHGGGYNQIAAELLTTNQGYLMAGTTYTRSQGRSGQMYLVETDLGGNQLQTKIIQLGIAGAQGRTYDMIRTRDQGYLLCGTAMMPGGRTNAWVVRLDAQYTPIWNHLYGTPQSNETAIAIVEAENGIYVLGSTDRVDPLKAEGSISADDSTDLYLIRINPDAPADPVWAKTYGYTGMDWGTDIVELNNGNLALMGVTDYPENGSMDKDVLLILLNKDGNVYNTMNLGDANKDEIGTQMILSEDGQHLCITGSVWQLEEQSILFLTVDINLNTISGPLGIAPSGLGMARGHGIHQIDNGFLICGNGILEEREENEETDRDILLLAVSEEGVPLWEAPRLFGDAGRDEGVALLSAPDGIILLGTIQFGSNTMMSLIKTDLEGAL